MRRAPRGVRKADYARRDFYDAWLPELSPSAKLIARAHKDWDGFVKAYRREMAAPAADRLLTLLGALSRAADFSLGCYCEDERRCHRSVLRELLVERGAQIKGE